jgi:hypothetical protein
MACAAATHGLCCENDLCSLVQVIAIAGFEFSRFSRFSRGVRRLCGINFSRASRLKRLKRLKFRSVPRDEGLAVLAGALGKTQQCNFPEPPG